MELNEKRVHSKRLLMEKCWRLGAGEVGFFDDLDSLKRHKVPFVCAHMHTHTRAHTHTEAGLGIPQWAKKTSHVSGLHSYAPK